MITERLEAPAATGINPKDMNRLWWLVVVQPGANALFRFALTGDLYSTVPRDVTIVTSVQNVYEHLGLTGWLANKRDGLAMLLGLNADWTKFGEVARISPAAGTLGGSRVLDFFSLTRSLGIATVGLAIMALSPTAIRINRRTPVILLAATTGGAGILLSLMVMWSPLGTHDESDGAILLLFLAGAQTLCVCPKVVKWGSLAVATGYFVGV